MVRIPEIHLSKIIENVQNCGEKTIEFVISSTSQFIEQPSYCDNRACNNPGCQEHRANKFKRKHAVQISALQDSMDKPKAWVFTGYILEPPLEKNRKFICEKTLLLYKILDRLSSSEFSLHCELKPKGDGRFFLHWHVVSGGLKDYHYAQTLWGRYIRYETAINTHRVSEYVAKYASKTPVAFGTQDFIPYLETTYKLRLHRFSTKQGEITKSDWIPISILVYEAKRALNQGRVRDDMGYPTDFIPFIDGHPPPEDPDTPNCVYVYPTKPVFVKRPKQNNFDDEYKPFFKYETFEDFMEKVQSVKNTKHGYIF